MRTNIHFSTRYYPGNEQYHRHHDIDVQVEIETEGPMERSDTTDTIQKIAQVIYEALRGAPQFTIDAKAFERALELEV